LVREAAKGACQVKPASLINSIRNIGGGL
jgi:hypothetical protein